MNEDFARGLAASEAAGPYIGVAVGTAIMFVCLYITWAIYAAGASFTIMGASGHVGLLLVLRATFHYVKMNLYIIRQGKTKQASSEADQSGRTSMEAKKGAGSVGEA